MANYGVINPPSPTPRGMHLATPARLGGRKSGLRRNPGMGARCAKTQYVKLGALQYSVVFAPTPELSTNRLIQAIAVETAAD